MLLSEELLFDTGRVQAPAGGQKWDFIRVRGEDIRLAERRVIRGFAIVETFEA